MLNTTPKPVRYETSEVKQYLSSDVETLRELRWGRDVVDRERLTAKADAVESGIGALTRAVKKHPEDADAAYREVIEKFAALAEEEVDGPRNDREHQARVQGRKEGLVHVLYRIRTARQD